ncbi:MAG: 4Fe-4S ferredoxin [Dehalococcoidia bacterium DG_22]|nr:MAG: 4Fe-4S ferredoxin [Dehalococcoidia bacterium DG_22]
MCLWCERYGEGFERWYLNPANYARRLYKVRKEEAEGAGAEANPQAAGGMASVGREFLEARDRGDLEAVEKLKKQAQDMAWTIHFGQVITEEEMHQILDIMYPIGLMTCACRRSMRGLPDEENFTCIGMGPGMYKWERWPDTYRGGLCFLTPDEAKEALDTMRRRGLVHTVFTFGTPYLGGLCNCDYPDCAAVRTALDLDIKTLWKGHYIAEVDADLCNGCGLCVRRCQFKALSFSASTLKANIDPFQCFGCGLCRDVCKPDAIKLVDRATLPAVAEVW